MAKRNTLKAKLESIYDGIDQDGCQVVKLKSRKKKKGVEFLPPELKNRGHGTVYDVYSAFSDSLDATKHIMCHTMPYFHMKQRHKSLNVWYHLKDNLMQINIL